MKLYELPGEYRMWEEAVASNGGEVTEELAAALDYIQDALSVKSDRIVMMAREAEAEAEVYLAQAEQHKAQVRDFNAKAQVAKNRSASLRDYLKGVLKKMKLDEVKGRLFKVSVVRTPKPSIRWASGRDIPVGFRRVKVEVDLEAAQEMYAKLGSLPEGFEIHHTEYLRIR